MRTGFDMKTALTYLVILGMVILILSLIPIRSDQVWEPAVIIPITAILFTLLIYLLCEIACTGERPAWIFFTAFFMLVFFPGASTFFQLDEASVIELVSQCIVPFFIGQYNRVSQREFRRWYMLMLLMGIFCSYTHDGITIPLCAGFICMAFLNRDRFFRSGCWPMVVGFLIGTGISVWQAYNKGISEPPSDIETLTSRTTMAFQILWDTKVFLLSVALTGYLSLSLWGRKLLLQTARDQSLLACCAVFSVCTLPFAPLGLENAVTGVCFFSMMWVLCVGRSMALRFNKRQNDKTNNKT